MPLRREASRTLLAVAFASATLGLLFWVLRSAPNLAECFVTLTADQRTEIDHFRAFAVPVHVVLGLMLGYAVCRLSAVRRNAKSEHSVGPLTLVTVGLVLAIYVAALVEPDVLAAAGVLQLFLSFIWLPLTGLVAVLAAALLLTRRHVVAGTIATTFVAWSMLVWLIPAHFAFVWLIDEPFCMS
jgi:hypothetical protein